MRNWAGNHEYRAARLLEPRMIDELQELVRASHAVRPLGSRHSFNDVADTTGDLISIVRLPRRVEIDHAAGEITVDGAVRYGDLAAPLDSAGLALHNLASLPHISVAGATATGTHGSGVRSGNLATAIRRMRLVRADGEIVVADRSGDPDSLPLDGAAVGLGALGVIVDLTLAVEPTYLVRQDVYEDLPLGSLLDHFEELASAADSVSFFTEWRTDVVDQVWIKRRVLAGETEPAAGTLDGATRATQERHPIRRLSPDACTPQLGVPGPWHARLPHFRLDHTPSAGDELQSEYLLDRVDAVAAILAVDRLRDRIAPILQVTEIRTIAADDLWLSPAYGRDSVAIHFTWQPDWPAVRSLLPAIDAALEPFDPRPHWGKLFTMDGERVRSRYERLPEFVELARRLDPEAKLSNAFLERNVFGGADA
jgi:xylitol oxidase